MSKPGLGKGLGDLMNGDQAAGKRPGPKGLAVSEAPEIEFGRGLTTLISAPPADNETTATKPKKLLLPAWFFFSADIVLLAYTVAITFSAPRPFDFGTLLFCAISVGLGGLLAVVGVLRSVD